MTPLPFRVLDRHLRDYDRRQARHRTIVRIVRLALLAGLFALGVAVGYLIA